jgi:hypothetical protein
VLDESNGAVSIRYEKPVDKFLMIEFSEVYEWLKKRENLYDVRDVLEWPQGFVVRYFIEEGDVESKTIKIDNKDDVMKFYDALKQHSAVLADGGERLRALIIDKFSPGEFNRTECVPICDVD